MRYQRDLLFSRSYIKLFIISSGLINKNPFEFLSKSTTINTFNLCEKDLKECSLEERQRLERERTTYHLTKW